ALIEEFSEGAQVRLCVKIAIAEVGGTHQILSSITEFRMTFAIHAVLSELLLWSLLSEESLRIINSRLGIYE
ncbi:hypothetical protein, partial [Plesiomonas shigelloides]|uniref:hypothetical protein n=1 Tax=Plesiomonas shigelloides TaxID=703 RepID=UPI001C49C236